MRHTLILGVAGFVAFSAPAFASTGPSELSNAVPRALPSSYLQVATNVEDGPLATAFEIFDRLGLEEAGYAVREGEGRAYGLGEIGNPNIPEEEAGDHFRCAVMSAAGVPIKCISY